MKKQSPILVVLKKLIFSPLVIAAIFFSSQESKAEGGCPNGLYPAGGGYCRNIQCNRTYESYRYAAGYGQVKPDGTGICRNNSGGCTGGYSRPTGAVEDPKATATLAKYRQQCQSGVANWGDLMVPKAR